MSKDKTSVVVIDDSFKFEGGKEEYETENFWAKMRIKKDEKRGDYYIDIVEGRKSKNVPHCHIGINADQSLRFIEPREVLKTINRRVESKLYGLMEDKTVQIKSEPGGAEFTFKVEIDGPSKTIKVQFSESGFARAVRCGKARDQGLNEEPTPTMSKKNYI